MVRIPAEILSVLRLKLGDKVSFVQNQNGEIVVSNTSIRAIQKAQEAFSGAAEVLGVKDDDDVMALVSEVRYGKS
ncbi:MAG: AbrB/MazE/SpoVT family DNA-binding domain-containing protein [Synergistaceae bacterium]|nr:AbrB/MazE/SpoVT family DNA-binding domain-containing protein [Synergistaceae bacterium]